MSFTRPSKTRLACRFRRSTRRVEGSVILAPSFGNGLRDLEGFSHLTLLYHLHRSSGLSLVVDGTPLLDIKPCVSRFDDREDARIGWFEGKVERVHRVRADRSFRRT